MSEKNIIITSCSSNYYSWSLVPFIASLRDVASYSGRISVIDYGLTESQQEKLKNSGIELIKPYRMFNSVVIDRFFSVEKYLSDKPDIVAAHFDSDIWFNENIDNIFKEYESNKIMCVKDNYVFTFLFDCLVNCPEYELNRSELLSATLKLKEKFGQVLQAGFICANYGLWKKYAEFMYDIFKNHVIDDAYGADATALNMFAEKNMDQIQLAPITYNAIPDWNLVKREEDGKIKVFATRFETDGLLKDKIKEMPIKCIHCGSGRGKGDYELNFKFLYPEIMKKWSEILL